MNYEQIENYLHDGLTEAERTAFEAEMATDLALAETVTLYRDIEIKMQGSMAAQAGEPALRQQLVTLNQQYFGKQSGAPVVEMQPAPFSGTQTGRAAATAVVPMQKRRILYFIAGAAAVLLVFLLVRPFGGNGKFDAEAVYAQQANYLVPAWASNNRGNSQSLDSMKWQVATLLQQKKYAEALPLLEKITEKDGNDVVASLTKGACYTETNDSARAMQVFLAVEAQPNGSLKDQAIWYKALLYLKYRDIDRCRKTLQDFPQGDWSSEASKLLKALPKP